MSKNGSGTTLTEVTYTYDNAGQLASDTIDGTTRKLMALLGLKIGDFDLIEINEAFASQGLACLRQLGVADDAEHVNAHGGAIALGHPLGMSGTRLALTAVHGLEKRGGKLALATMCVGVGQGVSLALERV